MNRIMGIDYGLKRIGIAITDFLRITASPFDTVKNVSLKKNALKILEIAKNRDVSIIVLGLPLNMNGTEGGMAETVRKFIEKIKFLSDIEVTTVDERLTTVQAERMLIEEADISREKRKGIKDKVVAALILQTYLDIQSDE
ncbi:Holliday junction resolvase RuvX [Candidatus Endomicrobiellum trichonymphae]|uniref:Putative pre-16S rRNA nuclease n=1 Tax=Endomicrobium trichonymphae TaxID=1408204 RepID=YQGF_ENDTX|nr:Holliday junction resolvase RuvX [Candidatus Endomicrobium trichonymphae]B1H0H2.1 RecName: Full=Putative pre-16S rRNA nuclease [Candidatus Endomicrobium trichonymphae]BAG14004.1 putative Holliday junction resolvase RuvX [Candidatus Endomicrobium trichonymphae]BAV59068.1 putative Holliday junction resolvase RuvX [Candidatus Endomicrobium trichonymphae]